MGQNACLNLKTTVISLRC